MKHKKPDLVKTLRKHTPRNVTQWTCTQIQIAMEDYGKQMYNHALDWAAENGTITYDKILYTGMRAGDPKTAWYPAYKVDKKSILKGKL